MSTVGTQAVQVVLTEETIFVEHGVLKNKDGTLAGSAISLLDAVYYLIDAFRRGEIFMAQYPRFNLDKYIGFSLEHP